MGALTIQDLLDQAIRDFQSMEPGSEEQLRQSELIERFQNTINSTKATRSGSISKYIEVIGGLGAMTVSTALGFAFEFGHDGIFRSTTMKTLFSNILRK